MAKEEKEIEEVPEIKKKSTEVELTEVPTETAQLFKLPDGNVVNHNDYLVWLGNNILAIKRSVA
jgi:hypothetical protein